MFDAGIAAMTFSLAAYDKGVGSCIMGVFDDAKVAEAIGLEEGKTVAALIPIGFPKFTPDATPRKETADLISTANDPTVTASTALTFCLKRVS